MFKQAGLRTPNGAKNKEQMFLQALDLEALKVVNGLERNTINEDEFLLLSEEIESKNPENRVTVFMLF